MRTFTGIFLLLCFNILHAQKISVITQHNNLKRTGWNDKETILNPTNVGSTAFGLVGSLNVDDQVYAQPLVVRQLTIGTYTGSVVFVATVNNTVYAFNADDVSSGAPLWQTSLNPAGQRSPNIYDLSDPVYDAPCGGNYRDFSGRFGIVGTPAIDTLAGTLYVVTKNVDNAGNFFHYLNALSLTTGQHRAGSPKKIVAAVAGTGDGSVNGVLNYEAKYQNQRPALLLHNNILYVASASHCDWGPYHGWILGYNASTLNLTYIYNSTPNGWAGGVWMAGQGISVGDDGNLYVVTGNGTTNPDNTDFTDGRSESLIKLSPQLQLLDWFTPANYQHLDDVDLDYGCDGALLIPNSSVTISGSKEGVSYVVDYNNMGKLTPGNAQVLDTLVFNPNAQQFFIHVHGSPVYAKMDNTEYVYAWAESFKIRQFTFDRPSNTFTDNFKQGIRNLDVGMPGAMLSISSNANDAATGLVWTCFPTSGNANQQVRPGTMAAYRAEDISSGEIWNSDMHTTDVIGSFAKFNCPTVANGMVYTPTFSNQLKVYGLKCPGAIANPSFANGSGLKAEYYTNSPSGTPFTSTPDMSRVDPQVNFNWGNGSPAAVISNDVFKARWTGRIRPLTNDTYTFYTIASDGIRLWVNNQLIIDSWSDKPATGNSGSIALQTNTDYDIRLEYYSNTNSASCILQWSANGICKQNIPASQLFASTAQCSSNGTGLMAAYFSNTAPQNPFPANPTVTNILTDVNFDWGGGSPAGISDDDFKARFTGYVQTLDAGTYTFYLTGDDGIRLWVDGQLVIDGWVDQSSVEYSAEVNLPLSCHKYAIKVEYYENGGDAVCKLEWSGPTIIRQPIPLTQLYTQPDVDPVDPQVDTTNTIDTTTTTFSSPQEFLVFPNPSRDHVAVYLKAGFKTGEQLSIYNMLGQKVLQTTITGSGPGTLINITTAGLPTGVYVVRLIHEGKKYKSKMLVAR